MHLGAAAGWDSAHLELTGLRSRLGAAAPVLADLLRRPTFPPEEVERIRQEHRAAILQRRAEPRGLANEAANRFVFCDASPFSRPLGGTDATLRGLSRDDVLAFHRDRFSPSGAALLVAGDTTTEEVERLFSAVLGDWSGAPEAAVPVTVEPRARALRVVVVDRPGAVQSELRVGQVGVSRGTPDYFPLTVMNAILGGAFTSRLNLNLRERQGFTYGVSSSFVMRREPGPFAISTAVQTEVTAPALAEILGEVRAHARGAGHRARSWPTRAATSPASSRSACRPPRAWPAGSPSSSSTTCPSTTSTATASGSSTSPRDQVAARGARAPPPRGAWPSSSSATPLPCAAPSRPSASPPSRSSTPPPSNERPGHRGDAPRPLASRPVHDGRIVHLSLDTVRLPDGSTAEMEMIRHSGAAAVLPVFGTPDDADPDVAPHPPVPLRRRRLPPRGPRRPARSRPASPGRTAPAASSRRRPASSPAASSPSPPSSPPPASPTRRIHLFLAFDLVEGRIRRDEDEFIEIVRLPLSAALEQARDRPHQRRQDPLHPAPRRALPPAPLRRRCRPFLRHCPRGVTAERSRPGA